MNKKELLKSVYSGVLTREIANSLIKDSVFFIGQKDPADSHLWAIEEVIKESPRVPMNRRTTSIVGHASSLREAVLKIRSYETGMTYDEYIEFNR